MTTKRTGRKHATWRVWAWISGVSSVLLLTFGVALPVQAHGADIAYTTTQALVVEVAAHYDSGDPMADAQVLVYTPAEPQTPWLTGVTDAQGSFSFMPDPALPGTWEVMVRQSGHGGTVYVEVAEEAAGVVPQTSGSTGYTPLQLALMSLSVGWGFIGTALYFTRRH